MWFCNFTLYRRVMWPLKMCKIPSPKINSMDRLANTYLRKWLGFPRCFSDTGLFGASPLQLLVQPTSLGFKQEKARLVLELGESLDQTVRNVQASHPNRKWQVETEVNRAISRLQHQNIVGRAQVGRVGFGRDETPHLWWRATKKQHKATVIEEIPHHQQIDQRYDLGGMPQSRFSFLLRATYNTLP